MGKEDRFIGKRGRGLVPVGEKALQSDVLTGVQDWWAGESNYSYKYWIFTKYSPFKICLLPQSCPHAAAFTPARLYSPR